MNIKAQNQLAVIGMTCMMVFMLGCKWQQYQKENSMIIVYADEITEYEPIVINHKLPIETQVEMWLKDLHDLPDNAQEVALKIARVFKDDPYTAIRVAHCESRLRQEKIGQNEDSIDVGVFQINQKWHNQRGNAYDIDENIRIAKEIYDEQGWNPWVCYWNYSGGW